MKATNKSCIHEEMKNTMELGNAYCNSVQNTASGNFKKENMWGQEPRHSRVVSLVSLGTEKMEQNDRKYNSEKEKTLH